MALRTEPRWPRVYLSPPHIGAEEAQFVADALASNWIAPLGPHVDAFEAEFGAVVGCRHAVCLSSGTAALHLGLLHLGVGPGDVVFVSTLTFAASAYPVHYVGAEPVFVDSEPRSWNMDPALLDEALAAAARRGRLPKAVILVHLYGQAADLDAIRAACATYGVPLVEDAAEALGTTYHGRAPGTLGVAGVFSFNGNKIVTTSGGGMLVTEDDDMAAHARKLASQARDPAPHYQHSEIGFNYRMSNVCAAIGRAQLGRLEQRVEARRAIFERYRSSLEDLPGVSLPAEMEWGRHTRWLSCLQIEPELFGADREAVRLALEADNVEARPLWKPLHLQPVFSQCQVIGGTVSERLFRRGLCLPSGSNLAKEDQDRIIRIIRRACYAEGGRGRISE